MVTGLDRWLRLLGRLASLCLLGLGLAAPAQSGPTLDRVKARGMLRCGVSGGIPGFSQQDAAGRWQGFDADICRAVAAAALGDGEQVEFVPLRASTRFPALQSGRIDLLVRNTSWTFTREALLGIAFPVVIFYDGQSFMVPSQSEVTEPTALAGATICVEKGTTHERSLRDFFGQHQLAVTPLVLDSAREAIAAFYAGRCSAYSSDASQLAAARSIAPGGKGAFRILEARISKEALAPATRSDDQSWTTLVRWVVYGLILAEEYGVTGANLDAALAEGRTPLSRLSHDERKLVAQALGLSPGWAVRAVEMVGNYGELYARHLGPDSPLGIERGPNRLWTQGGLLYAPPID